MDEVSVRYIVDDVEAAVAFYRDVLQFEEVARPGPGFAMVRQGPLRLLLNEPGGGGGAGQTVDGAAPVPGGWNRIQLAVDDLGSALDRLRRAGVDLRGDVIEGRGGRQSLVVDPSGNLVELFEAY